MRRNKLFISVLLLIFSALLLSGCSQKIEMTFFRNGKWRLNNSMSYPRSVTDMTGGFLSAVGIDLGSNSMVTDMTQTMTTGTFNLAKNELRRQGIDMDWEQKESGNNVVISIDLSADSFAKFNSFISSTGSGYLQPVGSDAYRLFIDYSAMNQEYYDMIGMDELMPMVDMMSMLNDSEVVINTGRIVDSNAHRVNGNSATWFNPTVVDITFVPRSSFPIGLILILLAVIVLVIIAGSVVGRRNSQRRSDYSYTNTSYNDDFFS